MSPSKRNTSAAQSLEKYRRQDRDPPGKMVPPPFSEPVTPETAKILEAISTCQVTLTFKIEEVKGDISLIRQYMHKLRVGVTETETRISLAKDILHPMQHTAEVVQQKIHQLAQKQNDFENRARCCNLHFLGLSRGI